MKFMLKLFFVVLATIATLFLITSYAPHWYHEGPMIHGIHLAWAWLILSVILIIAVTKIHVK